MNAITTTDINAWTVQGRTLASNHKALMWQIAEWMDAGAKKFGDAAQAIALETFGKSTGQLRKAMDVSRRFPPEKRRPELTFTHHEAVMKLEDDEAESVLDKAVADKLPISTVKKAVAAIRESSGGDVFQQMAQVSADDLLDEWTSKITRLYNRCPAGTEGRRDLIELLSETDGELVL